MMLLCGIAMISTSCNKDPQPVNPETEMGSMMVGNNTIDIVTAENVNYGQKNAIVLASKAMTAAENEGVAIIFNGEIAPGTYKLDDAKAGTPRVVGLKDFNMGEIRFVIDTIFFGDAYLWISGELSITENNGAYTVILSQCTATNASNTNINLSVNFNGTLTPYVVNTDNKFVIDGFESAIGLAGVASLDGLSSLGLDVKSMLFMSADRKRFFIVSYLGGQVVDGEYDLGYIVTPYVPIFPSVHVALDGDFWHFQPQTGYIAQSGTLKVVTNDDGTKTVTMSNLKLKNVEHDSEFFFPILDAELNYHGMMFEIGL
jgi:hypothetical protein